MKLLDPFLVEKSAAGCCAVLVGKRRMGGGGVVVCVYVSALTGAEPLARLESSIFCFLPAN